MLAALYVAAWALEIGGIVLIVLDIRDDRREARTLTSRHRPPRSRLPGRGMYDQGGQPDPRILERADEVEDALTRLLSDQLSGSLGRRKFGVVLVAGGATVGLVANLLALR